MCIIQRFVYLVLFSLQLFNFYFVLYALGEFIFSSIVLFKAPCSNGICSANMEGHPLCTVTCAVQEESS